MSGLRRWKNLGYVIAPLAFAILSITSTVQKSPTYDEAVHLFAGYSYLKWGDFRVNPEHPPLAKMLSAVPLLVLEPDTSGITPLERYKIQRDKNYGWVLAHRLVFANNDADTLFLYARLVMVTMAMGLALWVAFWTWELYGAFAASVALILFCADPNLIAHSAIVQTDFPFALFFFGSMYFFGRTLSNLSWSNLLMTAALFSAAVVTKFSALIILPIWLALGLIRIVQLEPIYSSILDPPKITGRWAKTASIAAIVMLGVTFAYLSIWLIYQLRFDAIVLQRGELPTEKLSLGSLSNFILSVARKYLLLPEALLFGLGDAYQRMERTAYLLGEISPNGFWLYFPVAFLVKTPVPTLLIIILAIVYQLTSRRPKVSGTHFLLVPVAVLFCFAIWSRLNVGWRHILPMYPLLFVWLGGMVSVMWRSERRSTRLVLYCLGVWLVTSTLMAYPNYLAYFNEAAGGSKNGRSILVDSNLDWGQDLKALKNWMTHNQIGKIQFAYFGTADPAYYKIDSVYLPGSVFVTDEGIHWHERPRYVAMSETLLAGLYLDKPDRYAQFRQREPVAIIGHSIRVFKLADEEQIE
jgi:hypothetical protein